jgi:metallophosphoesterase (TIGR00282 family)
LLEQPKLDDWIRILAVGDVIGRPGRRILQRALPILKAKYAYEALVVNVENAAGGFGMTLDVYGEFDAMGIDCMTSGNHIFDKREIENWVANTPNLLRPANYPPGTPGSGFYVFESGGTKVAVVNLMARVFMKPLDCPFRAASELMEQAKAQTNVILVDFHGEATSEKMALGWHLCGTASCVWGTHTHVPTADARLLDGFTAYQTDLGMTGPYDSVIGMSKEPIVEGFIKATRNRFEVAKDDPRIGGLIVDIERDTGRCVQLESLFLSAEDLERIEAERAD